MRTTLIVPVLLGLLAAVAAAQSTAFLTGTVVDPSGAVVPGALVECRNVETGVRSSSSANGEGLFRFPDIPVGSYELSASHAGFETYVRTGIHLLTGQTLDLTLKLGIGGTKQTVEVSAPTPLVQSTSSEVQTTVDSREMADLPLNGRNAFDLAIYTPGAVDTEASTIEGQQDNTGLAVNGHRPVDNNWQLDGASYTNRSYGSAPMLPNPDTLQEFTAQTSNFAADTRGGGASIKLTTRSGTNQFHGTLFEFLRNNAMDARNFFSPVAAPYKQNQFGGTLGGPIRKDKLFFFGSFQGTSKRGSPSPLSLTVPTIAQANGDFSATGKTIVDPLTGNPFPGDIIPKNRFDPIAAKLVPYYPIPNLPQVGANAYQENFPGEQDDRQWMIKTDYVLNSNDRLTGRYFWDHNNSQRDVQGVPGFFGDNGFWNQTGMVSETHTFSPVWVMRTTFNFLRTYKNEIPHSEVSLQSLGANIPWAEPGVPQKINVALSGYSSIYAGEGFKFSPQTEEFQIDFSRAAGRHFIRFGTGIRFTRENSWNRTTDEGKMSFTATRTGKTSIKNSGDSVASLLLGLPATFAQASSTQQNLVESTFDPWIQDDWKISRRLTLNLGFRWEPYLPAHDTLGALAGFLPGAHSTIIPLAPVGLLLSNDPGIPAAIIHNYWRQFSPRFGFAYDVFGDGKSVVRGGYGIFRSGAEFFGMQRQIATTAPGRTVSISIADPPSLQNPYANYAGNIPFPFTVPTSAQLASFVYPSSSTLRAFDPAIKPGYSQDWNFTVERQVLKDTAVTLSYVGNHFLNVLSRYEGNPSIYGPGATTGNAAARRTYKGLSDITLGASISHGSYHGLQVQVTKRTSRGLTILANYTFSKIMDIDSTGSFGAATGEAPKDPYNFQLNYGPADFDITHQGKIALIYDLPHLRTGARALRALANGWQINSMVIARTGVPFTCKSGVDNSLTSVNNDSCDQIDPQSWRPEGADPMQMWFNTKAFVANAKGTFGNSGRNTLRQPGVFNTNASVFRIFRVTEKVRAELRVESFNALNHTNLQLFVIRNGYTSSANRTSPTFGKIIAAQDPRLMQVALKLRF